MTCFQLTINESQAQLISEACDAFSRIRAGQVRAIEDVLQVKNVEDLEVVREALAILRRGAFLGQPHDDFTKRGCKEAFNLHKLLEHGLAWTRNPEGDTYNSYDGPVAGWWETSPASLRRFEGDEAVRIRDQENLAVTLIPRFEALIGTKDVEEAIGLVQKWKAAYERQEKAAGPDAE